MLKHGKRDTVKNWRVENCKKLDDPNEETTEEERFMIMGSLYGTYWFTGIADENEDDLIEKTVKLDEEKREVRNK